MSYFVEIEEAPVKGEFPFLRHMSGKRRRLPRATSRYLSKQRKARKEAGLYAARIDTLEEAEKLVNAWLADAAAS
jgi:hypothetical protein